MAIGYQDPYKYKPYPWETPKQSQTRLDSPVAPGKGETVTQTWAPGGTRPAAPTMPSLEVPEYDEGEVGKIAAKEAAPNVRRLRDVTARALGQNFENPNVKRLTVREALQGYGSGLGSILSGANRAAVSQYMPRYQAAVAASQQEYSANVQNLVNEYNQLWGEFLQTGTKTVVSQKT